MPSLDQTYRAREVDFLIRNVIFGLNIPAPIPPRFTETIIEELGGGVTFIEGDRRRECIGRSITAMYGHSTSIACLPVPFETPYIPQDMIGNDVSLAIMYGDHSSYFPVMEPREMEDEDGVEDEDNQDGELEHSTDTPDNKPQL